jgi:endonuclease/exonuclease/phosphatase family metal-dependent hydrolase
MQARRRWILGLLACVAIAVMFVSSAREAPIRIATFNIRNFPEHEWHSHGTFAAIADLGVPVVAVQEVRDVARFEIDAMRYLGPQWRSEFDANVGSSQRLGLVYDGDVYEFVDKTSHAEVGVKGEQRPALEVRLRARDGDRYLRVFVVHLKAGGKQTDIDLRRQQLKVLAAIVGRAMKESNDEIVVLGDFNAASKKADRAQLSRFARTTKLSWASDKLKCTAYWLPNGRCDSSALDHVFTRRPSKSIAARGPCEKFGCSPGESCPSFHEWVSDHCPVVAEF